MDSYLIDLSSLLLLGVLLGCHFLAFRTPARSPLPRAIQRAGKLRMLGVSVLAPISIFLWLQDQSPLLTLVVNQLILYWLGSTAIEVAWLMRRPEQPGSLDWRRPLRILWVASLILQAGWTAPEYRDLAYALTATSALGLTLLRLHRTVFRPRLHLGAWLSKLQDTLVHHGHLLVVLLSGYYLLRAWTVVPITSKDLHRFEQAIGLLLGVAAVEASAATLQHVLRMRNRSKELANLSADAVRAVLYGGIALIFSSLVTDQDIAALALSSAFFSIGLGFALKPTLGNFVAGLVMRLSRDFFIGDFVHIGPTFGLITHIDWRTVSLGTNTLDTITIPHNQVARSVLINYTRPDPQHASYLEVKLSHLLPPGLVRRQLLELLEAMPEVCKSPPAEVYLMDLNGFANTYLIRWWIHHINHRPGHESAVLSQLAYGLERSSMRPVHPIKLLQLKEDSAAH